MGDGSISLVSEETSDARRRTGNGRPSHWRAIGGEEVRHCLPRGFVAWFEILERWRIVVRMLCGDGNSCSHASSLQFPTVRDTARQTNSGVASGGAEVNAPVAQFSASAESVSDGSGKKGTFEALGLSPATLGGIKKMGYRRPTPIQRKTLPLALSNRDIVAMARTGAQLMQCLSLPRSALLFPLVRIFQRVRSCRLWQDGCVPAPSTGAAQGAQQHNGRTSIGSEPDAGPCGADAAFCAPPGV